MIWGWIRPESETIELTLPPEYVGKQVESIAFTFEESNAPYKENNFTMLASVDSWLNIGLLMKKKRKYKEVTQQFLRS